MSAPVTDSLANGAVYRLHHGDYVAEITTVGAGLARLTHRGRDLTLPSNPDEVRAVANGTLLIPWPNRITNGRYTFAGYEHALPLTEPSSSTAIHGLVMWVRWTEVTSTPDHLSLMHRLVPQPGYPFALDLTADYRLDDNGLRATATSTNVGVETAPFGFGAHPYLVAGSEPVDEWTLDLDAGSYLHFATEPVGDESIRRVTGSTFDFRGGARVGETRLNHPYTDLARDAADRATLTVTGKDGEGARITWDAAACPWAQLFTTDFPDQPFHRAALAVEPMSCPPNAFGNGIDLTTLEPGGTYRATWTISSIE